VVMVNPAMLPYHLQLCPPCKECCAVKIPVRPSSMFKRCVSYRLWGTNVPVVARKGDFLPPMFQIPHQKILGSFGTCGG